VYLCWIRPAEESSWGVRDERSEDWRTATAVALAIAIRGRSQGGVRRRAVCKPSLWASIVNVLIVSKATCSGMRTLTSNVGSRSRSIAAASPFNQSTSTNYPSFSALQNLRFPTCFLPFFLQHGTWTSIAWTIKRMIYRWLSIV
jgi:hypothetical protein